MCQRLFLKFRVKAYSEYYLLHQFIQTVLQVLKRRESFSMVLDQFKYVHQFLLKFNKVQAGRVTCRIIVEYSKQDQVQLTLT